MKRNPSDSIFQLRQWVFPKLFQLTDVGKNTPIDSRNNIPQFWLNPDALKIALTEDTELNTKINKNTALIQTLSPIKRSNSEKKEMVEGYSDTPRKINYYL